MTTFERRRPATTIAHTGARAIRGVRPEFEIARGTGMAWESELGIIDAPELIAAGSTYQTQVKYISGGVPVTRCFWRE